MDQNQFCRQLHYNVWSHSTVGFHLCIA
eukprot:Gb_11063 [translate_table: standard]